VIRASRTERPSLDGLGEFDHVAAVVLDHRQALTDRLDDERVGEDLNAALLEFRERPVQLLDPEAEVDVAAAAEMRADVIGRRNRRRFAIADHLDHERAEADVREP
jgi:hypothetical protein